MLDAETVRQLVEIAHGLLWVYLVYAVCCYPRQRLWIPLVILVCIPVSWFLMGNCPLTILENKMRPLSQQELAMFGYRNRLGMHIRNQLQISMEAWDYALGCITVLLIAVIALRMCIRPRLQASV